jgi:hypothetical protein
MTSKPIAHGAMPDDLPNRSCRCGQRVHPCYGSRCEDCYASDMEHTRGSFTAEPQAMNTIKLGHGRWNIGFSLSRCGIATDRRRKPIPHHRDESY